MDGRFRYWRKVLNFILDLEARKYVGVDVTNLYPEDMFENQRVLCTHWYRCTMRVKHLPNHNTPEILFSEGFLLGNPQLMSNPFEYSSVCFNFPGTE